MYFRSCNTVINREDHHLSGITLYIKTAFFKSQLNIFLFLLCTLANPSKVVMNSCMYSTTDQQKKLQNLSQQIFASLSRNIISYQQRYSPLYRICPFMKLFDPFSTFWGIGTFLVTVHKKPLLGHQRFSPLTVNMFVLDCSISRNASKPSPS